METNNWFGDIVNNDDVGKLEKLVEKTPDLLEYKYWKSTSLLYIATCIDPLPLRVIEFLLKRGLNPYHVSVYGYNSIYNIIDYSFSSEETHDLVLGMMIKYIIKHDYGLLDIFTILVTRKLKNVFEKNKKKFRDITWEDLINIIRNISFMSYNYESFWIFEYIIKHNQRKLLEHKLTAEDIDVRSEYAHLFIRCLLKYGVRFESDNVFFNTTWQSTTRSLKHIMQVLVVKRDVDVPYKGLLVYNEYEQEAGACTNRCEDVLRVGYYDYIKTLYNTLRDRFSID